MYVLFINMVSDESICSIAIQERVTMPEIIDLVSDNTEKVKRFITKCFILIRCKKKGR